jgi:hypothetical protein
VAVVTGIAIVVLTAPRGGIPLWNRLVYRLRGTLLFIAVRFPRSPIGRLTEALELPTDLVRLDGARVFAPPTGDLEIDLREWITFAHAREEDGLVFVDEPIKEGLSVSKVRTFLIEPFDIMLHATEDGVQSLTGTLCHLATHAQHPGALCVLADARHAGHQDQRPEPSGQRDRRRAASAAPDGVSPLLRAAR